MNQIAHYIESVDFTIKQKVRSDKAFDYTELMSGNFVFNKRLYNKIKGEIVTTFKEWENQIKSKQKSQLEKSLSTDTNRIKLDKKIEYSFLLGRLLEICPSEEILTDNLVYLFYTDCKNYNKATLWGLVGKQIYKNVAASCNKYTFPVKARCECGDDCECSDDEDLITFLYEKYKIKELSLIDNKEDEDGFEDSNFEEDMFDYLQQAAEQ